MWGIVHTERVQTRKIGTARQLNANQILKTKTKPRALPSGSSHRILSPAEKFSITPRAKPLHFTPRKGLKERKAAHCGVQPGSPPGPRAVQPRSPLAEQHILLLCNGRTSFCKAPASLRRLSFPKANQSIGSAAYLKSPRAYPEITFLLPYPKLTVSTCISLQLRRKTSSLAVTSIIRSDLLVVSLMENFTPLPSSSDALSAASARTSAFLPWQRHSRRHGGLHSLPTAHGCALPAAPHAHTHTGATWKRPHAG